MLANRWSPTVSPIPNDEFRRLRNAEEFKPKANQPFRVHVIDDQIAIRFASSRDCGFLQFPPIDARTFLLMAERSIAFSWLRQRFANCRSTFRKSPSAQVIEVGEVDPMTRLHIAQQLGREHCRFARSSRRGTTSMYRSCRFFFRANRPSSTVTSSRRISRI